MTMHNDAPTVAWQQCAVTPAEVGGLVERLRGIYRIAITDSLGAVGSGEEPDNPNEFVRKFDTPPIQHEAATALEAKEAELAAKDAEIAQLTAEKDAELAEVRAALTARAKTLLKLRDVLVHVHDHIEDEGDRVYFGSTNDAEILKDVWRELDGWVWDDIMADGKLPDVYDAARKAHARAERAEAELAMARKALEPFAAFAEEMDTDPNGYPWKNTDHILKGISAGDFRAARQALATSGGTNETR